MEKDPSDAKLVRKVRTFADDMRRAGAPAATMPDIQTPSPAPVPPPQKNDSSDNITDVPQRVTPQRINTHSVSYDEDTLDIGRESEGASDGVIVRDTIRKRWSLGKALGESLGEWAGNTKDTLTQNFTEPEPAVAPAKDRARIINKARTNSTIVPKDDQQVVVEKLRTFARDSAHAQGKEYSVVNTGNEPVVVTPSWSHIEGSTDETVPQEKEIPAQEKLLESAPSRDITFAQPPITEKTAPMRTYRSDAIEDIEKKKLSVPNIAAAEANRPEKKKVPEYASLRPVIFVGLSLAFVIAVGGSGFLWYTNQDANKDDNFANGTLPIETGTTVTLSTNRAVLLERLAESASEEKEQITYITPIYANGTRVPTSDFLFVLDPRAPGSFLRNLDERMYFGSHEGTDPFFIFSATQFDTAFAGMLEWEPFINADLTPLFGNVVRESLINNEVVAPRFVDDTIDNIDVRILTDDEGSVRIIYAFLDTKTLIITTSENAFRTLVKEFR